MVEDSKLTSIRTRTMLNVWSPVLDGILFTDYPTKLIQMGKFADIPVIVGYVSKAQAPLKLTASS